MATFNDPVIAAKIRSLDKFITDNTADEIQYAKNKLFEALGAQFDDQDTLRSYVFEDCDPLDREQTESLSNNEAIRESIRDIQYGIVAAFKLFRPKPNLAIHPTKRIIFGRIGIRVVSQAEIIGQIVSYAATPNAIKAVEEPKKEQVLVISQNKKDVVVTMGEAAALGACEVMAFVWDAMPISAQSQQIESAYPCLTAEQIKSRVNGGVK